jgi:hypothetical protein
MAERVGPAGAALAANIHRVRTAQRIGYAELSRLLSDVGRPIPELGLRRIEIGERRVDFDDLLALAYVLKVCPVDLMVSNEAADNDPYQVVPAGRLASSGKVVPANPLGSGSVRDWIGGQTVVLHPVVDPDSPFADPSVVMYDALNWMPKSRRAAVLQTLSEAEQWAINNPDDAAEQDQWLREHQEELHKQWIAERAQWLAEQKQKGTES